MLRRSNEYKKMVWKNGAGVTDEIDREPDGDGEGFHWRLSMATVRYPGGPFSIYENIDRSLAVIEGKSLVLIRNDTDPLIQLDENSTPFSFEGEVPIVGRISEDTITDFNVMTRRDKYRHHIERMVSTSEQATLVIPNDREETLFIVVAQGALDVNSIKVGKKDTIKFVGYHQPVHISSVAHASVFYIIRIIKCSPQP